MAVFPQILASADAHFKSFLVAKVVSRAVRKRMEV